MFFFFFFFVSFAPIIDLLIFFLCSLSSECFYEEIKLFLFARE